MKSFGLIPEIIGRLPVLTYLNPLDRAALRSILTEPKNSIIKQYIKLFEMDNVKLTFEDAVFEYIVDKAVEYKVGARGLRFHCGDNYDGCHVRNSVRTEGAFCCDVGLRQAPA